MIIGTAGKAGTGKDTFYLLLQKINRDLGKFREVKRVAFADEVKRIARELGWDGNKDEKGRRLLQLLGTEVGRFYNPNIWIDKAFEKIPENHQKDLYVITDLRFINEANAVKRRGGLIICVQGHRHNTVMNHDAQQHASEQEIEFIQPDFIIHNDKTLAEFMEEVRKFYQARMDTLHLNCI